jgi:hypothetical protein
VVSPCSCLRWTPGLSAADYAEQIERELNDGTYDLSPDEQVRSHRHRALLINHQRP